MKKIYDVPASCNTMSLAYMDVGGEGVMGCVCCSERLEGLGWKMVEPNSLAH